MFLGVLLMFSIHRIGFAFGCHETLDARMSGIIRSPNFPERYPENVLCNSLITTDEGKLIELRFESIELEGYDYLMIYDGPDCLSKASLRISRKPEYPIYSTGNTLTVIFVSDQSSSAHGFMANYSTVGGCSLEITDGSGWLPLTDEPHHVCAIRFTTGDDNAFFRFNITYWERGHGVAWMRFFSGGDCRARQMLHLTSLTSAFGPYVPSSNTIVLYYANVYDSNIEGTFEKCEFMHFLYFESEESKLEPIHL
ncbi:hypothetical protein PHET_05425 [Paragonimus heterotremus]|uniref:CUB domain-containing protein n=1 Tax=Paragonimus heterotremus TaxID=100268 RepID=A0A8J4SPV2_9TREM|nr:hypothetical protein PHET_05425 [Paragonimus heterotremus]